MMRPTCWMARWIGASLLRDRNLGPTPCRFRKVYPFSTWHSPGPERIVDHSQNQARVRVPGTAAQTRMVSVAGTRLEPRKSARPFKSPPQPGTSFLGRCVSCFTLGPADSLVSWRGHRAIGDGDCPFGRFLPTWPRWLPLAGPLSQWSSLHRHLAGGGGRFCDVPIGRDHFPDRSDSFLPASAIILRAAERNARARIVLANGTQAAPSAVQKFGSLGRKSGPVRGGAVFFLLGWVLIPE
jgi:hypothetical protein